LITLASLRRFLTLWCVAFCVFAGPAARAGDTLQRVIDFDVLRVGMSGNQPPLTMVDKDGQPFGFDVDLAMALASALHVKLDIRLIPFGYLMEALEKNEVDMVISGMAVTPQRAERVSFIGPYMMSGKSILTRNKQLLDLATANEFNSREYEILALKNSTSADFVREVAPDARLTELVSYNEGIQKLIEGKADAMVADMPVCVLSVMRYPDENFATLEQPLTLEPIAIAVSKDDAQFQNLIENYLSAYEKTGLLNKMRPRWFEDSTWIKRLP
jgi:ABC-type amino acid transport substrate-binding protein